MASALCWAQQHDHDYDEYVRQVIEEEQQHYGAYYEDSPYVDDERLEREQKEREEQLRLEKEKQEREQAERIRQERESAFEAEQAKMSEDQRKASSRQRKKDRRIVRQILKAAERGDYYAVLGLKNREIRIPSREFKVAGISLSIPGIVLFEITQNTIRKAYRARTRQVHPDKNRDGRAPEAFVAVEEAASLLSDDAQKRQYDTMLLMSRLKSREEAWKSASSVVQKVGRAGNQGVSVIRRVLGPFAFPAFVITSLLI